MKTFLAQLLHAVMSLAILMMFPVFLFLGTVAQAYSDLYAWAECWAWFDGDRDAHQAWRART